MHDPDLGTFNNEQLLSTKGRWKTKNTRTAKKFSLDYPLFMKGVINKFSSKTNDFSGNIFIILS